MAFEVQPAVKKETGHILLYTVIGVAFQSAVLLLLYHFFPSFKLFQTEGVSFLLAVLLSGLGGLIIAVLNFFLMGLSVQTVASMQDEKEAKKVMKASYSRRMTIMIAWCLITVFIPCFHFIPGILPLLYPSLGIRLTAILKR